MCASGTRLLKTPRCQQCEGRSGSGIPCVKSAPTLNKSSGAGGMEEALPAPFSRSAPELGGHIQTDGWAELAPEPGRGFLREGAAGFGARRCHGASDALSVGAVEQSLARLNVLVEM